MVVSLGLVALAVPSFVKRFRVEGRSMLQAYKDGDRLLVETLSYRLREPRIGEVAVVSQPGAGDRLDLKRIAAGPGATVSVRGADQVLGPDEWYVLGDNLSESTDSRSLGPLRRRDILGRAWLRY